MRVSIPEVPYADADDEPVIDITAVGMALVIVFLAGVWLICAVRDGWRALRNRRFSVMLAVWAAVGLGVYWVFWITVP